MKFTTLSANCNFPYASIKRDVTSQRNVFLSRLKECIENIPLDTYHRNRLDYLGVLKIIKKFEKNHPGEYVFAETYDSFKDNKFWKVHGVRLANEFERQYPQYSVLALQDITIVGHRSLNLSRDDLLSKGLRKTNSHMELDVCMSGNGEPVVHHDLMLPCGTRIEHIVDIQEYNLANLTDILRVCPATTTVYVDVKGDDRGVCQGILDAVSDANTVPLENIVVMSFNEDILQTMYNLNETVKLCFLSANIGTHVEYLHFMKTIGCSMIGLDQNSITPTVMKSLHEDGICVFAYTSNTLASLRDLVSHGIDGVITDVPNLFISKLKRSD